jgi:hypothetical protein
LISPLECIKIPREPAESRRIASVVSPPAGRRHEGTGMPFDQVERLKKEYTDKYVEVDGTVPELRRFQGLTGVVKTVNMGGRALVQFDHPVDISWYDIEPSYLKVVDKPVKKAAPAEHAAAGETKAAAKAPAAKPAGKSPLEMARAQGAAGAAKPAAAAAAPAAGGKPLSKIELARMQAAGVAAKTAAPPAAEKKAPAAAAGGKPLSKLEQARLQGAAGAAKAAPAAAAPTPPAPSAAAPSPAAPPKAAEPKSGAAPATKSAVPTTGPDGKPLSKIELARLQGAFKGNA